MKEVNGGEEERKEGEEGDEEEELKPLVSLRVKTYLHTTTHTHTN